MSTIEDNTTILEYDENTLWTLRLFNCVINAICSFTAAFGNGIILFVIWRTPNLHSPSNTLLFGLALTDFLVGLVTQPLKVVSVIYLFFKEEGPIALTQAFDVLSVALSAASFMIATAISVDRYLVFHLHMRYQVIVTNQKILVIIALCWICSTLCGFIWTQSTRAYYFIGITTFIISFIAIILMYYKIYRVVRHHQAQIQCHAHVRTEQTASSQLQFARSTKSAINTFYVCIILFLCFFPYVCAACVVQLTGLSLSKYIALQYTGTLTFLNSSLNPLVYFWRLAEIRKAIKRTLKCCYSRQVRVRPENTQGVSEFGSRPNT